MSLSWLLEAVFCVVTMPTECVAKNAAPDEVQAGKQQYRDDRDDSDPLHPAWCAGGRSAAGHQTCLQIQRSLNCTHCMISDVESGIPSTNRMPGMSGNEQSARFDRE